jgi:hypothetical protein
LVNGATQPTAVGSTTTSNSFLALAVDGGCPFASVITQDQIQPAFAPSLSLASGGSGPFECGATWTPTFTTSPAYNASGVTYAVVSDNQGHSNVAITTSPFGPPTVSSYTISSPSSVGIFATLTQNGVGPRNTGTITATWGQKVWYGVGTAGATGFNGSTGALSGATGTLTGTLSTSGIVAFSVSPSGQKVYYGSDTYYGTRTFHDGSGNLFQMNAPSSDSVTNDNSVTRTYYLYESTNVLAGVTNPITPS